MTNDAPLSVKQDELIAVGASIAAGCRPCSKFHFRAAQAAGADEEEIQAAVRIALEVRAAATQVMADLADQLLRKTEPHPPEPREDASLTDGLVALGAAIAVNCATTVEATAKSAWHMGAAMDQISAAVKIARAVREMAGKKAEAVLSRLAEASAGCTDDCVCHDESGRMASGASGGCCEPAAADQSPQSNQVESCS